MAYLNYQTATILSGQADSDALDLQGFTVVGIQIPAAITGATVAILESETVDGTFRPVNLNGTATTYTATASTTIAVPFANTLCARFIKIRSASNEGANRSIKVISRELK